VAESVREQALAKIVTKLQAMTGARPWGGTYPNDPVVERAWKDVQQVNQFPHLIVLEASGSTLEVTASGSANKAFYLHRFRVSVVGYVRGDDVDPRSRWIQRLWDDVVKTLLKNGTLDGVARQLDTFGEPDVVDDGEFDQLGAAIGAVAQIFTVEIDEEMDVV